MVSSGGRLGFDRFKARLAEAHASLAARTAHLEKLGQARAVTIYSYGSKGRELAPMLRSRGVDCVIFDNSEASRARARADGYAVAAEIDRGRPIIVAAGQNQIEILASLDRPAFNLLEALWAFDLPAGYGPSRQVPAVVQADLARLFDIYGRMDEESAARFLDVLECRASLDVHRLRTRRPVGEMWRPPVEGLAIASFCDIGAYDGDSLRAVKAMFPALERSFTIEPNGELEPRIAETAIQVGVANENFVGAAWSGPSRLDARRLPNGMFVIEEAPSGGIRAEALDDLLGGARFDFIKMDVEGTEREAITGGRQSIAAAVCVAVAGYHLPRDLIDLPAQLGEGLGGPLGDRNPGGWRLAFAHYSQVFDDSIFYAWRSRRPGSAI